MSPTRRTAALLAACALAALLVPLPLAGCAALGVAAACLVDAARVRTPPRVRRTAPPVLSRGRPARLVLTLEQPVPGRARLRQPVPAGMALEPAEADGGLDASLVPLRRGRVVLPAAALRLEGPLGLGAWHHRVAGDAEVLVYPDLPEATRLARAVRRGRLAGQRGRGPLGLGTEFESIREYVPDDDVRQINWAATSRLGRPMSNQHRVEQDRDVVALVDAGRLMAAPLPDRTRLDAAVDAALAVAAAADALGDRSGAIAFDDRVRREVAPHRRGARGVAAALFDVDARLVDSDYELAFRRVGREKRAFVLVLSDLLDEAAARPLVEAVPALVRRHVVCVASVRDPDLDGLLRREPEDDAEAYVLAAALDVLEARTRAAARLRAAGADVLEVPAEALGTACVQAYLRAKARGRL